MIKLFTPKKSNCRFPVRLSKSKTLQKCVFYARITSQKTRQKVRIRNITGFSKHSLCLQLKCNSRFEIRIPVFSTPPPPNVRLQAVHTCSTCQLLFISVDLMHASRVHFSVSNKYYSRICLHVLSVLKLIRQSFINEKENIQNARWQGSIYHCFFTSAHCKGTGCFYFILFFNYLLFYTMYINQMMEE